MTNSRVIQERHVRKDEKQLSNPRLDEDWCRSS